MCCFYFREFLYVYILLNFHKLIVHFAWEEPEEDKSKIVLSIKAVFAKVVSLHHLKAPLDTFHSVVYLNPYIISLKRKYRVECFVKTLFQGSSLFSSIKMKYI